MRTLKGALIIALMPVLLLAAVTYAEERIPRSPLRLQVGSFDPLLDGTPTVALAADAAAADSPYYIVQFRGPVEPAWAEQASLLGAELLGYLPENAYAARIAPEDLAAVRSLEHVRWVGPYSPAYKLAPALERERPSAETRVELLLISFPGEPAAALEAELTQLGATLLELSDTSLGVLARVRIASGQVAQLAALPAISWVEPYSEPRLANAEGRKILNAESVWTSAGLFGSGQIVAVSDSGLSVEGALSPDFEGRLVRAFAPSELRPDSAACRAKTDWTDLNGHGTHVAGSVLGSGLASGSNPAARSYTGSHAGVAPEARMVFMAMNTDGSSGIQCVPSNGNYIAFGYQNGARISSNSWGGSANGAYTLNDSVVDDYIWRNRDYLVLFAAGNAGPDPRTIGTPGSAKNIVSVGASENNRPNLGPADPTDGGSISNNPSQLAYFSSRGPTADGRIKPDLVAPGTNIISVLAAEAGGLEPIAAGQPYALSSGTSMATPLAAGSAALLREWLTTQRNVENPSAALLKALLIHGAVQLPRAATPNTSSGYGRIDLKNSIAATYAIFDDNVQGLGTGERRSYTIEVAGSSSAGTLFVDPPLRPAQADESITLQPLPPTLQPEAEPPADPAGLVLAAVPGHTGPAPSAPLREGSADGRDTLPPLAGLVPRVNPAAAAPLVAVPAEGETTQTFLQSMVGGGDFEDPGWSESWSQIWLGAGRPLRTSAGNGVVLRGNHSVWLGGSPSDDTISYPVSFPAAIDNAFPSELSFLVQMRNYDQGYDYFCVAITDASGYALGSGANELLSCGDELPGSTSRIALGFNAAQRELLAGESGYLTLFTVGDGLTPHMSTFVDDISLAIDFPNVTLRSAPGSGPPGTRFLLSSSYNVPYGSVEVCASSCSSSANRIGVAYADARGDMRAYLTTVSTISPGSYTIETRNVARRTARTTLSITGARNPSLEVVPPSGTAGTVFSFVATDLLPSDDDVEVTLNGRVLGSVGSDAQGAARFRITTSSNTAPGDYEVRVRDSGGRSATASYQVTAPVSAEPMLSVTPASGPPGTSFSFAGSGFVAGEAVVFSLDGQSSGTTTARADGGFAVTLRTTQEIAPGSYTLLAAQGERLASASFQITGGENQPTPTPSGNGIYLTLVWTDPPGQPGAAAALVNNLNLRMEGPGGVVYGNGGSGPDGVNNVETIRLERPAPGTYTVVVEAASVSATYGAQPFALLATTSQSYGANGSNAAIGAAGQRLYLPILRR